MKTLGSQFNKVSGPDATCNYKIEFTIDESQREGLKDFLSLKKGSEGLLVFYDVNENNEEDINMIATESEDESKERMRKMMHAMINDIAKAKKRPSKEIRKLVKEYLIKKEYMVESTKELTMKGYAAAIYYLKTSFGQNEYND